MKPSPKPCRGLAAGFVFLGVLIPWIARAQSVDIAPMTWTQRSDWINVKTDPNIAHHAAGDGVTDDTQAIQDALTLASASSTKATVYLPEGTYKITSTLAWTGTKGLTGRSLIGCGRNTTIVWSGASGGTMFDVGPGANRSRYIGIRWDGRNIAANGYRHTPMYTGEHPIRHVNEAFLNLTGVGLLGDNLYPLTGPSQAQCWTGDAMVWNCLFYNCGKGVVVGPTSYNEYQWEMQYCQFENCGIGIEGPKGKQMVYDSHFANSTTADISAGSTMRMRRCTSTGSRMFYLGWNVGTVGMPVIQDCWIDGWTNANGAIQITDRGQGMIFDTKFTNPPNTKAPIYLPGSNRCNLILSNNYCPTIGALAQTSGGGSAGIVNVPPGNLAAGVTTLSSPKQTFLDPTPVVDSAHILDVTLPPYNASKTNAADATSKIQQAITDAKNANNGSIVYVPIGFYKISSKLTVSGGNYTIEGSGDMTQILWYGANGGTMMEVTTPNAIALKYFMLKTSDATRDTAGITQTSTGASSLLIDAITYFYYPTSNYLAGSLNGDGPGVTLSNLPAGSLTRIAFLDAPLRVHDCGPAEIYCNYVLGGQISVDGATNPKTGFFGLIYAGIYGCDYRTAGAYDVTVKDNQDLIFGDYYNEQTYNNLDLEGGSASWSGRVTMQAYKQQDWIDSTAINVNNFKGRLFYGPQSFQNRDGTGPGDNAGNSVPANITHTGTNPMDLIVGCATYSGGAPDFSTAPACTLININGITATPDTNGAIAYMANQPSSLTAANLASMAQGFDHLRQLGWEDLKLNLGISNILANPSAELDAANPNPTATLGYVPAGWTLSGAAALGSGVRNVTTDGGSGAASPFGAGSQSIRVIDNTAISTGGRLDFVQQASAPLSVNKGALLTFDFRLNTAGASNNIWIRAWANNTASTPGCFLYLSGNATSGRLGANTSAGTNIALATNLGVGTWYRVQVAMGAPSTGPATAKVYLTPWTASGPGATTSYTVKSFGAALPVGFYRLSINTGAGGDAGDINLDNITLTSGDPLVDDNLQAPAILVQPQGSTVNVGSTATFSVAATGLPAPSYQWYKNGVAIPGATAADYTTASALTTDNASTYSVVVSNAAGSATSNQVVLNVPIFQDDASALSGATRGIPATTSITSASPFTTTSGSYLGAYVPAGASGAPAVATYTPSSSSNSWAALAGGVTVNGTAYATLNGAFDLFIGPNALPLGAAWFRPVDVDGRSGASGLRLIFNGDGNGAIHLEAISGSSAGLGSSPASFTTNTSLSLPDAIKGVPGNLLTAGSLVHLGVTFNTNASTGQITMKVFGARGVGAIDTSSSENLLAAQSFYASAAALGSSPLPSGAWSMKILPATDSAVDADYDTIRLYSRDPGVFLGLGTPYPSTVLSAYHVGNSLSQDMWGIFPNLAAPYQQSLGSTYAWGDHFRSGTSITYLYNHPADAANASWFPSAWNTALPGNRWDIVTLEPFPDSSTDSPATLATDTAAINGMIAAAKANPANASTRFFLYEAWPSVTYADLDSYGNNYLAAAQNVSTQPGALSRSYFAYLIRSVHLANPAVAAIPVGEVFYALDVRMRAGQIPGFASVRDTHRDSLHLNAIGKNIAAWTTYATVFDKSPVGLPNYYFAAAASPFQDVVASAEAVAIIQQTVWDVVNQQKPVPVAAVSRKTHGGAGSFDIPLNVVSGAAAPAVSPPVECRAGTSLSVVVTFDRPVVAGSAVVSAGAGVAGTPVFSGSAITIPVSDVSNAQTLRVTLSNVTSDDGGVLGSAIVSLRLLAGDVNADGFVNALDMGQDRLQSGQAVTAPTAVYDVDANGNINILDLGTIRSLSGTTAP